MGYPPSEARGALRLSLGRGSSDDDVAVAERVLPEVIDRVREGQSLLARGRAGETGAA
jgi:cysteine sulfinate desulfinase/cysteine desulfurase-like protein